MARQSKTAAAADPASEGQAGAVSGSTINGIVPTHLETKFAFALVSQFKSKPDIDWDQVATIMGMSKKSAIERWRVMRIKFGITFNDEAGDGAAETPGSARKGRKSTVATTPKAAKDDGKEESKEDQDAAPFTPAKRGRKPAGAGKKTPTPGSAAGRKRRAGPADATTTSGAAAAGSLGNDGGKGAGGDDTVEREGPIATASPSKKIKAGKKAAAAPATPAATLPAATSTATPVGGTQEGHASSPLSSVPGMTADEGSGDEMEV
ncbi:hypothetical protein MYCTH_96681 [Thermothelomyces thermophilus ATCC 42464]|uniref:Myb-like domain-containing protein n=1 Tax=Thermothelomyces thermophilus (strain ATCC 42464 / BCRC 31852 / DSM 1799) TaxID=573729 RepID=G2QQB9_THET4|nr:uncharacterized protein MYCTH_96681 [Thermothelomyces thermophilus ATCC 42464]AEO61782.1 hypothetical protein MYCTH_96681 [Thermothelomyces thermophilus ATCC 42464]